MTNDVGYVMTELDLKARNKGFCYKMFPIESTFDPMYARDIKDIETIEEMFSGVLFEYVTIGINCPLVADYWR
jgi:hypothetical protein